MPHYRRILVPVDGSEPSNRALVTALQLARDVGGRVLVLHDISDLLYLSPYSDARTLMALAHDEGERVVKAALDICASAGVPAESRLVTGVGHRLGEVVSDAAVAWNADLIVLGSHGRRGLQRLLLGSGAEQILRLAPVATLVVRERTPSPS
ncbi:universal stress protein [Ramlibacter sp. MMS24-I3-19]|uniref:universal stress protein n=1 Tax=Ramlibacter sp. MMS24-I3-19 TaxID=3416606 RepID=UPI003CFCA72A